LGLLFKFIVAIGSWYDGLEQRRLKDPAYRNLSINRLANTLKDEADTFYSARSQT